MTDIAEIGIRADITELQNAVDELNRLADQGQRTEARVSRSMGGVAAAFASIAGALGAGNIVGKLIETERETGALVSTLRTVTGSAQGAQDAFAAIQVLASQLPETLGDVTTAFTTMANLGLDPSEAAIRSYSNTASAMGKDLMQMIEAVADASGLEFERLKEFGIKSKQQGDTVSFTFQGVTKTVKKSSDEIIEYLQDIGNINFGGSASDGMIELDGILSNLGDTWDGVFRAVNAAGTGELIKQGAKSATAAIQELSDFISSGQMGGYIEAIGIKFEWVFDVAIAGFNTIKDAAVGLYGLWYMVHNDAMMAMGTTTDDFFQEIVNGFTSAPENIKAFIQVIVVELLALSERAAATGNLLADALNPKNMFNSKSVLGDFRKEMERIDSVRESSIQSIFDEKVAVESSYNAQIKKANDLRAAFEEKNKAAKGEILGKFGKGGKGEETATEAQLKAAKELLKTEEKRADKIKDMISDMTRETYLMGEQSKEAQTRYDIEHGLIEVLGGVNGLEAQSLLNAARLNDEKRKQIELDKQLEDKLADDIMRNSKEAMDAVAEWGEKSKKEAEELSRSLTDALMRGFESGKGFAQNLKDTVSNLFKTLVIKPVIQPIANKASEYIQKAVNAAPQIVKDIAAVGTIVGSLWNDYMEKDFKELTSEFRQGRQSTGTLLGNANAKSDSINKALSEMGDNGASLLDVNHGMYQALLDIKTGISGSAAGFARQSLGGNAAAGISTGTDFANLADAVGGGFLGALVNGISKALYSKKTSVIDSGIQIIGGTLADALETGMVGALNYAEVKTTKKVLGLTTSSKVDTKTSSLDDAFKIQFAQVFEGAGKALEEASKVFGAKFDASKLMIDATKLSLKGLEGDALTKEIESFFSSTLDKWAGSLVDGLTQFQEVGEGAFETMVRLSTQTNIFTSYAEKLLPKFNLVGMAAIEATQSVAELSGGFDRLNTNMGSYYNNFFDESEKSERGLAQISEALAGVGLAMPKTRDEFRALVESLDLTSESQQKQYAALLDVNQAFAQFVPAAESVKGATEQLKNDFNAIADQQKSLSAKLFELTATDAQKRQAELDAALSVENRAIQQQIFAALDLADATKKAAGELSDMQSKMAAVAQERYGLETQLLTLQGNTQALRERELATLDESNRPLQEQIWALEEAAKVAQESADAQSRAYEEASRAAQESADEQARLIKGTQDALTSAIRKLRGESGQLNDIDRQRAKNTLNAALAAAQSGQSIVGFAGLEDAVSKISELDKSQFVSAEDYQRELGRTLSVLDRLSGYAGMPSASTNPVIGNGAIAMQSQTNQQMAQNMAAVEDKMTKLTVQIEDNTKRTKMMLERWESIGMPASRTA